jgi:hypothetical protein
MTNNIIGESPVGVDAVADAVFSEDSDVPCNPLYTAQDIISLALKDSGILGIGQSALAEDSQDALTRLNFMIGQWNRRRWLVYHLRAYLITSTGANSYTVGPGGDFDIARRPDKIESGFFRQPVTGGLPMDYPLQIWHSREDWDKVGIKTLTSFSGAMFYDSAYPMGHIYFWPVPQASLYQMSISVKETLMRFDNLTTGVCLPDEYLDALYLNLAKRLRMAYQLAPNPDLNKEAALALDTLRRANTQVPQLVMPKELRKGQVYNPYSDQMK